MKVHIAYGWPEGNWHGKTFRDALIKVGYQITNSPDDADVIVAHSAGCYTLPSHTKAKVVMLIGLPNWPNKLLVKCTADKVIKELKDKYWFKKTFFHIIYGISQPIRLSNVYKKYKSKNLPQYTQCKVVLVHNAKDSYMHEGRSKEIAKQRKWFFKSLKGQHDDLWQNPQPYINLIKEYLV